MGGCQLAKTEVPSNTRKDSKLEPQSYTDEVEEHHCPVMPVVLKLSGVVQVARFKGVPGILVWSPVKDARTAFKIRYCPWCGKDASRWLT